LCIVHPNGVSTPLRLGDANSNYWGATWSPDGSRLVFAACPVLEAVNQKCSAYLYIADQDGSNVTLLLNDPPGKWQSPTWSPDGEWIAYESGPGLFLIRPDGSGKQLLTQMPIAWWSKWPIAWSPDSQQIAVLVTLQNASTGKADAVWVANRDGSGEVRSIFNSDVPLTGVAWSPDGQFVAVELENGKAYKIAAKCDNQLAGCEAWAQTEIESIPEYWLPNFYPQWVSEATPPATTATTSP
jgi:Tol biopolymer transport system component